MSRDIGYYQKIAEPIAELSSDEQVALFEGVMDGIKFQSVVGRDALQRDGRWYCAGVGISGAVGNMLRLGGFGEQVWVGKHRNAYRWYFQGELLTSAANLLKHQEWKALRLTG